MPEQPNVKTPVEIRPDVAGEEFVVASGHHAPYLYFENAPAFGHINGVIRITLEALRDMPGPGRTVTTDRVVVAHLRMNIPAAVSLRDAINNALLLAAPAAGTSANAPKPN